MSSHVRKWDTSDELMYLDKIGGCHPATRLMGQRAMLQSYLRAAKTRHDWGDINRDRAVAHATKLFQRAPL